MRGVSREKKIVNFLYKRRIHIHTRKAYFRKEVEKQEGEKRRETNLHSSR